MLEALTNGCNIRKLIIQYRTGEDIGEHFTKALNYLSKNSKILGHDLYPLNPHKELHYATNRRWFYLDDYVNPQYNHSISVFLIKDNKIDDPDYYKNINIHNKPQRYKRNHYFEENMTAIGGGNLKKLKSCQDYIRCGGSTIDKVRYLAGYDSANNYTKYFYDGQLRLSPKNLAKKIKPDGAIMSLKIMSINEVKNTIKVNYEANPGYLLSQIGFSKKKECVGTIMGTYDAIYDNWIHEERGCKVHIYWTMASRPKITTWEKAIDKSRHEEALGRVISLPDAIEQWLHHPIWHPIMSQIKEMNKYCQFGSTPIMLGLNRVGYEWNMLRKHMKKWKYVYTGDWSKFDRKINMYLFENAIEAISMLYDMNDPYTKNYVNNWKSFMREEVMNGTYVIEKSYELERVCGVPSGSLFTSLIDSIINYNAIYEVMCSLGYEDLEFEVGTYGDDHFILFNDLKERSPSQFKEEFFGMSNAMFNFSGSIDDACLCKTEVMEVRYKRPIYKEDWTRLIKGTSDLKPVKMEYSPYLFKEYDLMKGQTHRQSYDFKGKPKFLAYGWRDDGMPIRPLIECEARILNPERPVQNLNDHEAMIWSWIFENLYNTFFVNDMYYVLMDIAYLREEERIWGQGNVSIINECAYKHYYYSKPIDAIDETDRMWFRRKETNGPVDLSGKDEWIREFTQEFEEKYRKLHKIYFRIVNNEYHYDVRNQLYNHINRNFGVSKRKKIEYPNNDTVRFMLNVNEKVELDEDKDLPEEMRTINNPKTAPVQEHIFEKMCSEDYLRLLTLGRIKSIREINAEIVNAKMLMLQRAVRRFEEESIASMSLRWNNLTRFFEKDFLMVQSIKEIINEEGKIERIIWTLERKVESCENIVLYWMTKRKKYKELGNNDPKLLQNLKGKNKSKIKKRRYGSLINKFSLE